MSNDLDKNLNAQTDRKTVKTVCDVYKCYTAKSLWTPDQSEPYVLLNIPFQIQQIFKNVIFNLVRTHAN